MAMRYVNSFWATLRALLVAALASSASPAPAQAPGDSEAAAWEAAQSAGTIEAYQRYLEIYPLGPHAAEAFRSIVELSTETEAPGGGPPDPAMDVY
jgi:hypothetical protein